MDCLLVTARTLAILVASLVAASLSFADQDSTHTPFKIGIIGLDTSHVTAFTRIINDPNAAADLAGCRVVAAYPQGSTDIESSVSRIPAYTRELHKLGVEIVPSIAALLDRVDGVLLETNDGRPHLEQIRPVLKAGKPVFVDKPLAGTMSDAVKIFTEAEQARVPIFSASSLRFMPTVREVEIGAVGNVIGCDAFSPCKIEKTHPDLFWYGIHGVETLFAIMGPGCESVVRISSKGTDVVVGRWKDGRIGTFRGIRDGKGDCGGTVFGTDGIMVLGPDAGYRPLVVDIVKFFRTGIPPVTADETLEIYAFMEAADESKRRGGVPVQLSDILDQAVSQQKESIRD